MVHVTSRIIYDAGYEFVFISAHYLLLACLIFVLRSSFGCLLSYIFCNSVQPESVAVVFPYSAYSPTYEELVAVLPYLRAVTSSQV
jgi:hypothetical protein